MSTHATPETRDAQIAERTADRITDETVPAEDTDLDDADEGPAPIDPFDAHDAAATFDGSTTRLPNTVDEENRYLS
ncbi:MAG: hypothetical protein ABEJ26_12860 [Halosimplex sp.]